jgi:hypothetical protein
MSMSAQNGISQEGMNDPLHTTGTRQTPPNHPNEQPGSGRAGGRLPGDAVGPDVFGEESGPLSAPREAPPDDYHPERGYVGSAGGLGGGQAMGISTHQTTAGEPVRGREPPVTPENWSGVEGEQGSERAGTSAGPAAVGETENAVVESQRRTRAPERSSRRDALRGSAAPEHDVGAAPGVAPTGPHGWPLSTGGAPTVTGGEGLREREQPRGTQTEGDTPELGVAGEP